MLALGVGAAALGVAAMSGKAKAAVPSPAVPDDEEPPRPPMPRGKAPLEEPPKVDLEEAEELDEEPTDEDVEELAQAVREDDAEDDAAEPEDEDVTDEEIDDIADAVASKDDEDEDEAEQVTLTPGQRQYLASVIASIRGSRTLTDVQGTQLEAMVREVLLGIDGGPGVLDALQAAGHPPTAATWCRLMGGALEGIPAPLSDESQRNRYPEARSVVQAACAAPAPPPAPAPAGPERKPVVTVTSPRSVPVESEPSTPEPEGPTPPPGYNPVSARKLSKQVARNIDAKGCVGYSRQLLRQFQRSAGIAVDGLYGGGSRGALVHYGIRRPPEACVRTQGSKATRAYPWAHLEG